MAFDPGEFLRFARKIHGDLDLQSPAGIRTAVSRCYYSALLTAKDLLEHAGKEIEIGDSMHTQVACILLSGDFDTPAGNMGDDLANMNELRVASDFDVRSSIGIDHLARAHSLASIFNRNIKSRLDRGA